MNPAGHFKFSIAAISLLLLASAGCRKPIPPGALVLTQSPAAAAMSPAADILEAQYPFGSRIVLMEVPLNPQRVQVLSEGLAAAGDPIVSYDGQRVLFAGKADRAGDWQIYQKVLAGGRPQKLTSMPGGAMNPALLPDGSVVFASPVPKIGGTHSCPPPSALYAQSPDGQPRQLTFSSRVITYPTLLADGRILFVSSSPPESPNAAARPALFTINNDGTEITAFARPEDRDSTIQRPRPLPDGRVIFLISKSGSAVPDGMVESVHMARPFQSHAALFPDAAAHIRSVQPADNGDLLVCAENPSGAKALLTLFRVNPAAARLSAPLFADPAWNNCEAVELSPHPRPMGRISTLDPAKNTGQLLCLDANYTGDGPEKGAATASAARVRLLAEMSPGNVCALGEVPVQADGSFMAEVPAGVPLGFETLDANGRVMQRQATMLWVRPGENRACIGCHEPHNRSPHNHRPFAVSLPVPCLRLADAKLILGSTGP